MAHDDRHDGPAGKTGPTAGPTAGPTDEDTRRWGYDPANDRPARGIGERRPGPDGTLDADHDPGRDDHLATGSGGGDWESSAAGIGERRGPIDPDQPFELSPRPGDALAGRSAEVAPHADAGSTARADAGPPHETGDPQAADAAFQDDIRARLAREPDLDAGDVSVTVEDGTVTLVGTVADRPTKHAIESLVDRCPGVRRIDNRIKVMRGGLPPDPDAPPTPRPSVPADSPTARDEARGRHSEPTSDRSGYYG
ncbi:MAG: BON domain-containing protein [Burkholderiales bacterium]|nr:MAG: BON domain-containing protein [Burkholderiales bacterium]